MNNNLLNRAPRAMRRKLLKQFRVESFTDVVKRVALENILKNKVK